MLLTVAEPALNRRAACTQLNEQDTLTLACLHLRPDSPFKWQKLGTALLAVEDLSYPDLFLALPPSPCWLTLLSGHCAHSLSVAISSKLHETHYSHIPPGGDGVKQHLHKSPGSVWMTGKVQKSLSQLSTTPLCALSISSLPLLLIFLLYTAKGWIRMTFLLLGSSITALTSSESWAGCSSLCGERLNCVSSPQDAEGCSAEREMEMSIMQYWLNRRCTHMHTYIYVCAFTRKSTPLLHTHTESLNTARICWNNRWLLNQNGLQQMFNP